MQLNDYGHIVRAGICHTHKIDLNKLSSDEIGELNAISQVLADEVGKAYTGYDESKQMNEHTFKHLFSTLWVVVELVGNYLTKLDNIDL